MHYFYTSLIWAALTQVVFINILEEHDSYVCIKQIDTFHFYISGYHICYPWVKK